MLLTVASTAIRSLIWIAAVVLMIAALLSLADCAQQAGRADAWELRITFTLDGVEHVQRTSYGGHTDILEAAAMIHECGGVIQEIRRLNPAKGIDDVIPLEVLPDESSK